MIGPRKDVLTETDTRRKDRKTEKTRKKSRIVAVIGEKPKKEREKKRIPGFPEAL